MQVGGLYERMGQLNQAAESYKTAIRLQPYLTGPRSSLAAILENKVVSLSSQIQARSGTQATSKQIDVLSAQINELRKRDHELLGIDIQRAKDLPGVSSLHYSYGMSCYLQDDFNNAEKHLKIATEMDPQQPGYKVGIATYYLNQKKSSEAEGYINELLKLDPDHPGYLSLKRQLELLK